ncbi:MAG: hypothetical protein HW421_210 [Ignavibacteria bacterium]|nr:hypothetical protein [Ignavibacteria bacterium]
MNEEINKNVWEKRTVAEEPRLSELVELYRELGFEVRLDDYKLDPDCPDECTSCMMQTPEKYKVIYTRHIN